MEGGISTPSFHSSNIVKGTPSDEPPWEASSAQSCGRSLWIHGGKPGALPVQASPGSAAPTGWRSAAHFPFLPPRDICGIPGRGTSRDKWCNPSWPEAPAILLSPHSVAPPTASKINRRLGTGSQPRSGEGNRPTVSGAETAARHRDKTAQRERDKRENSHPSQHCLPKSIFYQMNRLRIHPCSLGKRRFSKLTCYSHASADLVWDPSKSPGQILTCVLVTLLGHKAKCKQEKGVWKEKSPLLQLQCQG